MEYEDVVARPDILRRCPATPDDVRALLDALYSICEWVPIYYLWRPNLQDEADNHVVELAIAGQARWLVTQNIRDFKSAELRFNELGFLTPEQLLKGELDGNADD